jgi:hypothetical protein
MNSAALQAIDSVARDIKRMRTTSDKSTYQELVARYRLSPSAFAREILNIELAAYQVETLDAIPVRNRVAIRGPRGLGKTTVAGALVLWGIGCFENVKIITTAGASYQLEQYLWPEVRKWGLSAHWDKIGLQVRDNKELLKLTIALDNRRAFAVSPNDPGLIEGAHEEVVIVVIDEAKMVDAGIYKAIEGMFSGAGKSTGRRGYVLAISTPGGRSGRFYELHAGQYGAGDWWVRHVTKSEALAAGRISQEWIDQMARDYGTDSAIYQQQVEGNFADTGQDALIPLPWIEAAITRWHERNGKGDGDVYIGVDPAYTGEDQTGVALLVGDTCERIELLHQDLMTTVGQTKLMLDAHPGAACGIDPIGVGAGVCSRLEEIGYRVQSVNAGASTDMTDRSGKLQFVNVRAALWWALHDALDPANGATLALPPDRTLMGDLTAPKWKLTSAGKIQIESKDDIRKRLNRSTDAADALALALFVKVSYRPNGGIWC